MKIADSISCELFERGSYEGCEESELHLSESSSNVNLQIETERRGPSGNLITAISLQLQRVEPNTISKIQQKLGEWLASDDRPTETWKTRPLTGEYNDSSSIEEIQQVEISLSNEGMDFVGITPSGKYVDNAVSIPPMREIHDDIIENQNYLYRAHSMLEIFLSGYREGTEDLLELSGHLVHPETHFHQRLPQECFDRLDRGDHKGVVQRAGETLETFLHEQIPTELAEATRPGTQQAARAFNDENEGFLWGYVPGEQNGIQSLYTGAFQAFRNPTSHDRGDPSRNRYLDHINKRDAIDTLCFFNFLMRKLEIYGQRELELDESEWDL